MSFDCITAIDVLEHVCDPNRFIRKASRVLRSEGKLILQVPNRRSIHGIIRGCKWGLILPPGHISYFTPKSIARLLKRHGFTISKIVYLNAGRFPIKLGSRRSYFVDKFARVIAARVGLGDLMTVLATLK